jgi:hypothetical protein
MWTSKLSNTSNDRRRRAHQHWGTPLHTILNIHLLKLHRISISSNFFLVFQEIAHQETFPTKTPQAITVFTIRLNDEAHFNAFTFNDLRVKGAAADCIKVP